MIAKKYEPQVKLIRSSRNLGYSAGNNLGIRIAGGEYIFLVNNDAIIHPDCICELVKVASSDPRIGILGCKVYYRGTQVIQHTGGKLDLSATSLPHIGIFEEDHGQYDEISDVDYVSGVAMMIKRELINKIGLLDERYFAYWEDVDYCFRARKAGFRIVYVPKAIVEHFEGFSWRKKSFLQKFLSERNRFLFVLNNFSNREMAVFLLTDIKNITLRMVEAFRRIISGKSSFNICIASVYVKRKLTFSAFGIFQWGLALIAAYLWLIIALFKRCILAKIS
jgi:GT2 family glycosyltransferase